jgi:hypothetical protein
MTLPTDRATFGQWCLRKLGHPVIEVNVDPDQVDDRIDEALIYYGDFHFEGTESVYFKYQVTAQDIANKYITLPPNIIGAVDIFPIAMGLNTNNLFNIRYQIALNDLYTLTSVSMVPYYMAIQHIQFLEYILVGKQPFRYNRYNNQFHLDTDWTLFNVNDFIIIQAYSIMNPDLYPGIWSDRWLQRYATCLIKQQWGHNTKKFGNMQMPGGIIFTGQQMYDEATIEREKLEAEMINTWSLPATHFIG